MAWLFVCLLACLLVFLRVSTRRWERTSKRANSLVIQFILFAAYPKVVPFKFLSHSLLVKEVVMQICLVYLHQNGLVVAAVDNP